MNALAEEIQERGIKFTVDSLVRRLGISKKTLYHYYSSKEAIICDATDDAIEDMRSQQDEIMKSDEEFSVRLAKMLTIHPKRMGKVRPGFLDDLRKYYPEAWARISRFREEDRGYLQQMLEEGIRRGNLRTMNVELAVQMMYGTCSSILDTSFLRDHDMTLGDGLQQMSDMLMYGLCNDTTRTLAAE